MAGLNMHHNEEEQSQFDLEQEQTRLRAEIEQELRATEKVAQSRTDILNHQEKLRQTAAFATWERQEEQQRQTAVRPVKHRSYTTDALLLCAVTLGLGSWLGPTLFSPVTSAPVVTAPVTGVMPMFAGTWTMQNAYDDSGYDWNGSSIQITSHYGNRMSGYIDWQRSGEYIGREQVSGSYDPATRQVLLDGSQIDQVNWGWNGRLIPGEYTATVGPDGKTLTGGFWTNVPGGQRGIDGHWGAAK